MLELRVAGRKVVPSFNYTEYPIDTHRFLYICGEQAAISKTLNPSTLSTTWHLFRIVEVFLPGTIGASIDRVRFWGICCIRGRLDGRSRVLAHIVWY